MSNLSSVSLPVNSFCGPYALTPPVRNSNRLNAPLWKKRAEVIAKIPHFWTLVFEQCPPELDAHIQPSDSKVFVDCLETLEVSRFEIDEPKGSPRSFSIKFGFAANEYFENRVLEKKFWFRKSKAWAGLVSEPVKIDWKKGQDLTGGLTDAAYAFAQARKRLAKTSNGSTKLKKETDLSEHKALVEKIEESNVESRSFFTFFGFVSSYRWISAEESEQADKEDAARIEKLKRGEKVEEESDEDEDQVDFSETEVHPFGDEIATLIAEDLWPSAIKYYSMLVFLLRLSLSNIRQSTLTKLRTMGRQILRLMISMRMIRTTRLISAALSERAAIQAGLLRPRSSAKLRFTARLFLPMVRRLKDVETAGPSILVHLSCPSLLG